MGTVATVDGFRYNNNIAEDLSDDANGGTGRISDNTGKDGLTLTLPENGFTPPLNQYFQAWRIGGKDYNPGDVYTITGNTTVRQTSGGESLSVR